jgi:membrane-anchored protein YejM (alkaline phosphatase superfamily)
MGKNETPSIRAIAAFALLHVGVWALMSSRYFLAAPQPADWPGSLFAVLFALGHFFLFGLALALPPMLARLALRRRLAPDVTSAIALTLGTIFTGALATDITVFTLFKTHMTPSLVGIFLAASPLEIYEPPPSFYVTAAGVLACLVLAERALLALSKKETIQRWVPAAGTVGLLSLIAFNLAHAVAEVKNYPPILARIEALPCAQPLSDRKLFKSLGVTETKARDWGEETIGASLDYPKGPIRFTPPGRPLNIIVIFVDSWRMDSFTETVMPRLYARARTGQVFTNHLSGGNNTRYGVFSFFYGLPSSYFHSVLAGRRTPLLLETLSARGYDFGLCVSAGINAVDLDTTSFAKLRDRAVPAVGATASLRDQNMENNFREFLKQRDPSRPFFGLLFYALLHGGSTPFPGIEQRFFPAKRWDYLKFKAGTDSRPYLNHYYNVAYTLDVHLAAMLDDLKASGRFEDTVIIITGDHAEEANDSLTNSWGHNSNFSRYQIQVPFIMFRPGQGAGTFSHRTTHADVARTLMETVLGASPDDAARYTFGRNLFDAAPREIFICSSYTRNAIIQGDQVHVLKKYGFMESYDLDGQKSDKPLSLELLQKALAEMAYFYQTGKNPVTFP